MVKQLIKISFGIISAFILLTLAVIPHHHHEALACFIIERCELDDNINDEHTEHNNTANDYDEQSCVAESKFINSRSNNELDLTNNNNYLFSFYYLATDYSIFSTDLSIQKPEYGEYIQLYKYADVTQSNGLRAPPHYFS